MLNLTQHPATAEQKFDGVVDLPEDAREELVRLLTFENRPMPGEIRERAHAVLELASSRGSGHPVMLGAAPWFGPVLEAVFVRAGRPVFYAFSRRESVETMLEDGSVKKTQVFRHGGFVPGMLGTHDFLFHDQVRAPAFDDEGPGHLCEGGMQCDHGEDSTHWVH